MSRVAAVDVGTNSVRLLIAEPAPIIDEDAAGSPLRTVHREMRITRLGRGVDAHAHLDDGALSATLACIADYARRWRSEGVDRVRITATSAVRDAADRERFFAGVRASAGVDAEVLSGAEEARTAFVGATAALAGTGPWCVLDIGGGSTELIRGDRRAEASTSRQLGCVRLTERCLPSDPPTADEVGAARAVIGAELEAAARLVDPAAASTLVGVAGTCTTLAALHLGLGTAEPDVVHGTRVPLDGVRALTDQLLSLPSSARAALGPMTPGREDVIAGGALILLAAMERFGFPEVLVSEADILDGLALGLLSEAGGRFRVADEG